jgi:hypothetical protein
LAVYRLVTALCRRQWFAAEVCSAHQHRKQNAPDP